MIEQYLQVALELFKEIWFQLDSILGIEETETFKLIKPYFLELQDNITYMGIALVMLTLIPVVLHKARSIARERERNMEKLMEDMDEEEYDNINFDTQKVMGNDEEEFKLEAIGPELAKPNLKKDVAEFKRFDFDSQGNFKEGSTHESTMNRLTEQLETTQETTSSAKDLNKTNIDDGATLTKDDFKEPEVPKTNTPINEPERRIKYSSADKSGGEAETQINRLKYLQELDKRFNHGENEDTSPRPKSNVQSISDSPFVEKKKVTPKSPKVTSTINKKYMGVLESFIFLKDQKNH
jgi:hypothetical protein